MIDFEKKQDDADELPPDEEEDLAGSKVGLFPEYLKKAVATGLSAVFFTEEGIRNTLGDMRFPKEAISYITQQTERSRKELFRLVSDELKGFLQGIDLTGEFRKALEGLKVEVNAEIKFIDEGKTQSKLKAKIKDFADSSKPKTKSQTTKKNHST